jgi:hypothetical protein
MVEHASKRVMTAPPHSALQRMGAGRLHSACTFRAAPPMRCGEARECWARGQAGVKQSTGGFRATFFFWNKVCSERVEDRRADGDAMGMRWGMRCSCRDLTWTALHVPDTGWVLAEIPAVVQCCTFLRSPSWLVLPSIFLDNQGNPEPLLAANVPP